ncbi:MAG: hypothetical protein H6676_05325 [Thermoflexaceae bacterium]|nr:hypothetical protein [Thermoflexaceae bacterium]
MAFLEVHMVQVREIIRRWQAGENKMAIGRASGVSARTVGRYIEVAASYGVMRDGEPPGEEVLAQLLQRNHPGPLPAGETMQQHAWQGRGATRPLAPEEQLQLTRVHELLIREGDRLLRASGAMCARRDCEAAPRQPYGWRIGRRGGRGDGLRQAQRHRRCRDWQAPDRLGVAHRLRAYSRHCFAWPLVQQTLAESIAGLEAAWRFFSGVPSG